MGMNNPTSDTIPYIDNTGKPVEVFLDVENDTVWLNRNQMTKLFDRDVKTIGKHINNALKEELNGLSVVAKFATTAADGKTYQVDYYNLDVILSVGYRVKSNMGTQFRIWANKVLKEHLLKGYTVRQPASMEQLRELRDELDEVLERQSKMDTFVYEEFGKVYELLTEIIKQKKIEEKPRRRIGFRTSSSID